MKSRNVSQERTCCMVIFRHSGIRTSLFSVKSYFPRFDTLLGGFYYNICVGGYMCMHMCMLCMCVCMSVYIYALVCTCMLCMCVCMCVCIHALICTCMLYVCVCMYACLHTIRTYVCVVVFLHECMDVRM